MRAVQIARFGGPEVLDVVDLPDPTPGDGQRPFDVSTAGVNYVDTTGCDPTDLTAGEPTATRRIEACARRPGCRPALDDEVACQQYGLTPRIARGPRKPDRR